MRRSSMRARIAAARGRSVMRRVRGAGRGRAASAPGATTARRSASSRNSWPREPRATSAAVTRSIAASASSSVRTRSWSASWPPIQEARWRVSSIRSSSPPERYALAFASSSSGDDARRGASRARAGSPSSALPDPARIDAGGDLERARVGVLDDRPSRRRRRARRDRRAARNRRLLMPSPRIALSTASAQASGWSRGSAGHADAELGLGRVAAAGQDPRRRPGARARARSRGPRRCRARTSRSASSTASACSRSPATATTAFAGPVRRRPEGADAVGRQRRARRTPRRRSRDPSARRPEHRLLEQDLGVLGGVVEVAADLLDDDLALAVDLGGSSDGPADQLAEDRHRPLGLAARHADPVDRRLAIRGRVERAADALDRLAQRARRRVRRRALERQVLEEVGHAGLLGRLEARAGAARTRRPRRTARAGSRAVITRGPSGSAVRSNIAGMVPEARLPADGRIEAAGADGRRPHAGRWSVERPTWAGSALEPVLQEEDDEGDRDDPHQRVDLG